MVLRWCSAAAATLLSTLSLSQMKSPAADSLIRDARQKLVPDRRTQVFDIHALVEGDSLTVKGDIHSVALRESLLAYVKERWAGSVADSLVVLPHPSLGGKTFAVVTVSVANLRTRPEHSEEMATQVLLGTPLRVLKTGSGWLYVQTPEGYLGWTDDLIVQMDQAGYSGWEGKPKVIVTSAYSFAHRDPDPASPVVSDIVIGDIFWLRAEKEGYFEVGYPDGRVAYVLKDEGMPLRDWLAGIRATPESVVATAKKFFGIPYLWGGTSSKALDCSGFTKTVYFLNGILLPRDADQQAAVGDPVDTSDNFSRLQAGDLLFFGAKATATRKERVTHVGISLGGMRFIHESADVHYNSLDPKESDYSDFRRKGLLRVRRILGSANGLRFLKDLSYFQSHGL